MRHQTILWAISLFSIPLLCFAAAGTNTPDDLDGDGLPNALEDINRNGQVDTGETDPLNADTDGGGQSDGSEKEMDLNPLHMSDDYTYDADADGIINEEELRIGTNPQDPDTDHDGAKDGEDHFPLDARFQKDSNANAVPDEWEGQFGLSTNDPMLALADTDHDGLSTIEEFRRGSNPVLADTDGDGIADSTDPFPTAPAFTEDSDHDGLPDGWEKAHGFDPHLAIDATNDTDLDGLNTLQEYTRGTDPKAIDSDGDGARDDIDAFPLDKRYSRDADRDGIADEWEKLHALSPLNPFDAAQDPDADGKPTLSEFLAATDPKKVEPCFYPSAEPHPPFADLPADHWASFAVALLHATRVVGMDEPMLKGYQQGNGWILRPDASINRADFLKLLLLSRCIAPSDPPAGSITEGFNDLSLQSRLGESPAAQQRRQVISTGVYLGVIKGYPDGTVRAASSVNRAEAVVMLLRLLPSITPVDQTDPTTSFTDVPDWAWYAAAIRQAMTYDLLRGYSDGTFRPQSTLTRAEAAVLLQRVMERTNVATTGKN